MPIVSLLGRGATSSLMGYFRNVQTGIAMPMLVGISMRAIGRMAELATSSARVATASSRGWASWRWGCSLRDGSKNLVLVVQSRKLTRCGVVGLSACPLVQVHFELTSPNSVPWSPGRFCSSMARVIVCLACGQASISEGCLLGRSKTSKQCPEDAPEQILPGRDTALDPRTSLAICYEVGTFTGPLRVHLIDSDLAHVGLQAPCAFKL